MTVDELMESGFLTDFGDGAYNVYLNAQTSAQSNEN